MALTRAIQADLLYLSLHPSVLTFKMSDRGSAFWLLVTTGGMDLGRRSKLRTAEVETSPRNS